MFFKYPLPNNVTLEIEAEISGGRPMSPPSLYHPGSSAEEPWVEIISSKIEGTEIEFDTSEFHVLGRVMNRTRKYHRLEDMIIEAALEEGYYNDR